MRLTGRGMSYWAKGSDESENGWPCTLKVEVSVAGRDRGILYIPLTLASSVDNAEIACSEVGIPLGTL